MFRSPNASLSKNGTEQHYAAYPGDILRVTDFTCTSTTLPFIRFERFLCTTRTVTSVQPGNFHADGNIVLDFKNKRITLQYDIITAQQIKKVLYRDVYIKNLKMPGAGIYTFDVDSVKVFSTDTAGDFLAHFRLLHPGAANEIRVTRVGNSTYLYSINRQIYNVCTLQ